MLLFITICPAFGAIVLQHVTFEEGMRIIDKENIVASDGTRIQVCSLTLTIKGPGFGTIRMTHTPLFDGVRLIGYDLVFEDGSPAVYHDRTLVPQEVELPCIWATLHTPLSGQEFGSTITISLTVER